MKNRPNMLFVLMLLSLGLFLSADLKAARREFLQWDWTAISQWNDMAKTDLAKANQAIIMPALTAGKGESPTGLRIYDENKSGGAVIPPGQTLKFISAVLSTIVAESAMPTSTAFHVVTGAQAWSSDDTRSLVALLSAQNAVQASLALSVNNGNVGALRDGLNVAAQKQEIGLTKLHIKFDSNTNKGVAAQVIEAASELPSLQEFRMSVKGGNWKLSDAMVTELGLLAANAPTGRIGFGDGVTFANGEQVKTFTESAAGGKVTFLDLGKAVDWKIVDISAMSAIAANLTNIPTVAVNGATVTGDFAKAYDMAIMHFQAQNPGQPNPAMQVYGDKAAFDKAGLDSYSWVSYVGSIAESSVLSESATDFSSDTTTSSQAAAIQATTAPPATSGAELTTGGPAVKADAASARDAVALRPSVAPAATVPYDSIKPTTAPKTQIQTQSLVGRALSGTALGGS